MPIFEANEADALNHLSKPNVLGHNEEVAEPFQLCYICRCTLFYLSNKPSLASSCP